MEGTSVFCQAGTEVCVVDPACFHNSASCTPSLSVSIANKLMPLRQPLLGWAMASGWQKAFFQLNAKTLNFLPKGRNSSRLCLSEQLLSSYQGVLQIRPYPWWPGQYSSPSKGHTHLTLWANLDDVLEFPHTVSFLHLWPDRPWTTWGDSSFM